MTTPPPSDSTSNSPDVGSVLRQARMRRGQSLEVVAQQTRIPKKMLEALETNRFEEFPAIVYLRGFLKNYCDHLDLDFDPLWAQLDPSKAKAPAVEPAPAAPAPAAHASNARAPSPTHAAANAHHDHDGPGSGPNATQLLPFVLVAGLIVAGGGVWLMSSRKAATTPPPEHHAPPQQPPSEIAPINAPRKMVLRIQAKQDAWMQLSTDGALRFQGRAPLGLSHDWEAMDSFILRTKDPGSLSVFLDGKELELTDALKTSSGDYKIVRP